MPKVTKKKRLKRPARVVRRRRVLGRADGTATNVLAKMRRADLLADNLDGVIGRIAGVNKRLSDLVGRLGHPLENHDPVDTPSPIGSISRALEKTALLTQIVDKCHDLLETVEAEV